MDTSRLGVFVEKFIFFSRAGFFEGRYRVFSYLFVGWFLSFFCVEVDTVFIFMEVMVL